MAAGRPTKYKKIYAKKLIDFFDIEPSKTIDIPHYKKGELAWIDKKVVANPYPKFHEFAKKIGVHRDKISVWAKLKEDDGEYKHPEFHDAYTYAKELQKSFLIENGLNGLYNPGAFIFVSKNITDMKDKQEVDLTSKGKEIAQNVYVVPSFGDSDVSENTDK